MVTRARTVAVGIFTFVVAVLSGLSIFFLSPDMLSPKYTLYTQFKDVIGLTEGSAVRLSGRYVGQLTTMELIQVENEPYWRLALRIHSEFQESIRNDSVASSQTQGLLGKKYINITLGGAGRPVLKDGQDILGKDSIDLGVQIERATKVLENIQEASAHLTVILERIAKGDTIANVDATLAEIAKATRAINQGPGVLHQLIHSPTRENVGDRLSGILADIESITDEIKSGEGTLHAVIYGGDGKRTLANVADATESIKNLIGQIEAADPDARLNLLEDLNAMSASLRSIVGRIESGEGTLGALIEDPTVYQDLKTVLGGAQRSALLRAVVRFAIENREEPPSP